MAQIISVIFFTAYILKSRQMGNTKKTSNPGAGGMSSLLSEKKSFEVIKNSPTRFKDVAGLDQSKV